MKDGEYEPESDAHPWAAYKWAWDANRCGRARFACPLCGREVTKNKDKKIRRHRRNRSFHAACHASGMTVDEGLRLAVEHNEKRIAEPGVPCSIDGFEYHKTIAIVRQEALEIVRKEQPKRLSESSTKA